MFQLVRIKTKVDDLDVDKLKAVPVDLKKIEDVVIKNVVKKTMYVKLNTKVNDLEKKTSDAALFYINQYNIDKQNLEKELKMLIKKYLSLVI